MGFCTKFLFCTSGWGKKHRVETKRRNLGLWGEVGKRGTGKKFTVRKTPKGGWKTKQAKVKEGRRKTERNLIGGKTVKRGELTSLFLPNPENEEKKNPHQGCKGEVMNWL